MGYFSQELPRKDFMQRRSFLKGSLALMGSALVPRASMAFLPDLETVYDCIILGAGPAGMTAARQLTLSRIQGRPLNVLVLEGSSRIGGRLFTDASKTQDFGAPLELGAEYVHMPPGEAPIWEEILRYGLQTKMYPKTSKGYLYNSEFLAPVPKSIRSLIMHLNFKLMRSHRIYKDIEKYRGPDLSGTQFIQKMNYQGLMAEIVETLLAGHTGASLDRISILGLQADKTIAQLRNSKEYYVRGGYGQILEGMRQEISAEKILLNHPVRQIRSAKNGLIQAHVPSVGWFKAKSMLNTASIGMMKSGAIDFGEFWNQDKEEALKFIVPAHQMKVSIRFKNRFWDEDMCMLTNIESRNRRAGMTYFVPHFAEENQFPVLTALVVSDAAKRFQSLSPTEIVQTICADFDTMYQFSPGTTFNSVAQKEDGSLIISCKKWIDDPFAKGGISNLLVHDAEGQVLVQNARAHLASSEKTRPLFWAGEATSLELQPSSVHGAHSTGLRAADEIYRYMQTRS